MTDTVNLRVKAGSAFIDGSAEERARLGACEECGAWPNSLDRQHHVFRHLCCACGNARGVKDLDLGRFVVALRPLDGGQVPTGKTGVVVALHGHFEPDAGPLVAWAHGHRCNVYEGDVAPLRGVAEYEP